MTKTQQFCDSEEEYCVILDTLQKKLDALIEMQKGCDNSRMIIGGGIGMMDCIRYEQIDELTNAIKSWKANKWKI